MKKKIFFQTGDYVIGWNDWTGIVISPSKDSPGMDRVGVLWDKGPFASTVTYPHESTLTLHPEKNDERS